MMVASTRVAVRELVSAQKSLPNAQSQGDDGKRSRHLAFRVPLTDLGGSVNHLDGEGLSDLNNPAMHKIVSTAPRLNRALLLKTLSRATGYVVRAP
jgi:hypothetical protein